MAAKIFAPPSDVGDPPELITGLDYSYYQQLCREWTSRVQSRCRNRTPNNDLVGMVWRYPVADGCAQYVVMDTKPLSLIHLPLGDAWHIPDIVRRGLTVSDLKAYKKTLNALPRNSND